MKDRMELRISGSGGQGVILCSVIIAEAMLMSGKNVVQSQSYGPEARGGMCKAEVIADREEIDYSKIEKPDFLLALTQEAFNRYAPGVRDDGMIVSDTTLKIPDGIRTKSIIRLPILKTASNVIGNAITSNIVAAGVINALLDIVPEEILEETVLEHVPKQTAGLNSSALKEGANLVKRSFTASVAV
jgi:2-oxoglutarate ferredoxin oxidoreductase subunit gamma